MADAGRPFPELVDAGAEKSAGREPDGPAPDACPVRPLVPLAQLDAVPELCTQDVGLSAERSCAGPVSAAEVEQQRRAVRRDAARRAASAVMQMHLSEARRAAEAQQRVPVVSQVQAEAQQRPVE